MFFKKILSSSIKTQGQQVSARHVEEKVIETLLVSNSTCLHLKRRDGGVPVKNRWINWMNIHEEFPYGRVSRTQQLARKAWHGPDTAEEPQRTEMLFPGACASSPLPIGRPEVISLGLS